MAPRVAPDLAAEPRPRAASDQAAAGAHAEPGAQPKAAAPHVVVSDAQLEPTLVEARLRRSSYLDCSIPVVSVAIVVGLLVVAWLA